MIRISSCCWNCQVSGEEMDGTCSYFLCTDGGKRRATLNVKILHHSTLKS
jgi:hypothetical protein